jgi:hypothetical protein
VTATAALSVFDEAWRAVRALRCIVVSVTGRGGGGLGFHRLLLRATVSRVIGPKRFVRQSAAGRAKA